MNKAQFFEAVEKGEYQTVSSLLDENKQYLNCEYNGIFPLTKAIEYGHKDIVELLINEGADLSRVGQYVFDKALWSGNLETVEYLYPYCRGFQLELIYNESEKWTHRPTLTYIAEKGFLDIIKFLWDKKLIQFEDLSCTFDDAVSSKNQDTIKYYLENGVVPNSMSLCRLFKNNKEDAVRDDIFKLLLEKVSQNPLGKEVSQNILDKALHYAAINNRLKMAKLIIESKCSVTSNVHNFRTYCGNATLIKSYNKTENYVYSHCPDKRPLINLIGPWLLNSLVVPGGIICAFGVIAFIPTIFLLPFKILGLTGIINSWAPVVTIYLIVLGASAGLGYLITLVVMHPFFRPSHQYHLDAALKDGTITKDEYDRLKPNPNNINLSDSGSEDLLKERRIGFKTQREEQIEVSSNGLKSREFELLTYFKAKNNILTGGSEKLEDEIRSELSTNTI